MIPLNKRICKFCEKKDGKLVIEDEDHVLHICPLGSKVRERFLQQTAQYQKDANGPDFNLVTAFRIDSHNDQNLNITCDNVKKLIRLTARSINEIYNLALNNKKGLETAKAKTS